MSRARPEGQNKSSAVMQQRSEPNDSLDDFPTPPWAVRAVLDYIARYSPERLGNLDAREPCANRGHMLRACQEYFAHVDASDVHDYGLGLPVRDYLWPDHLAPVDWTIMNPPFRLADQFIMRALETSRKGIIVIARSAFLEGQDRYRDLFKPNRPSHVLQFVERVCMLKGRLVRYGMPDPSPENPERKATTATAYVALVWFKDRTGPTTFDWIEQCRLKMEKPGDYPDDSRGLATLHFAVRAS